MNSEVDRSNKPVKPLHYLILSLANLISPGSTFAITGLWPIAVVTQVILYTGIIGACWTRLIFETEATQILAALILSIHTLSLLLSILIASKRAERKPLVLIPGLIFFIGSTAMASIVFNNKAEWLGVQLFSVSSRSMEPTLEPGELMLIDSWIYNENLPQAGDIVVFSHGVNSDNFVKRVSLWPDGSLSRNNQWYVTGDNTQLSHDSRYFGGIARGQIIGKVRRIIYSPD